MSSTPAEVFRTEHVPVDAQFIRSLPWDAGRGTGGMWLFMLSELMIFVALFFAYFYLCANSARWPPDQAPAITIPIIILIVLLVSCAVLEWARRTLAAGRRGAARIGLLVGLAAGAIYIVLTIVSLRKSLSALKPWQDSYGSIFYTILGVHAVHQVVGILLLAYALLLPLEPTAAPPHRPYTNSALYWYFATFVWLAVVCIMYLPPHFSR